ncbi:Hypothetical protein NTJ_07513 [Nesidiocoris tenuis]|uniref:Uncharacterized protein n=1 Tax=Nesidiocoris tenuis TaxID=355587 RepID=A0ABN7AR71_9HEMI|nr:Hypothetical protein NTJ_07513 [Nesidiocoris tenuis]
MHIRKGKTRLKKSEIRTEETKSAQGIPRIHNSEGLELQSTASQEKEKPRGQREEIGVFIFKYPLHFADPPTRNIEKTTRALPLPCSTPTWYEVPRVHGRLDDL